MRHILKYRPSPAMAVACVALSLALGGTATAAGILVTGKQIKDGTVAGVDVRNGSLTGAKVRNESLTGADVNEPTLAKVPAAASADTAASAATANSANTANTATSANTANTATSADTANTATSANTANTANTANSAGTAAEAGKLDGFEANELVRVARVSTNATLTLTVNAQAYGPPLSITAPAAGFVMIHGSTTVKGEGCASQCIASGYLRHIQSGQGSGALAQEALIGASVRGSMSHAWMFPVNAGVNTFQVMLSGNSGGTLSGWYGELSAIYVPFGSTGAKTP